MDDLIAQFIAVTSCSPQKAQSYLKVSDGDLENAVALFFNTGGIDIEDDGLSSPPPLPARPAGHSQSIQIDDDDDDDDVREPLGASGPTGSTSQPHAYELDEAMARRLQDEFYAVGGRGATDEVRAPIARTTETLIGSDIGDDGYGIPVRQRRVRAGIFSQQSSVWDRPFRELTPDERRQRLDLATGGASTVGPHAGRLAELFRPPAEIISHLGFEEARDEGKTREKWILINIQEEANFSSQVLNRDIWKAEEVQQTIVENFIFLQWLNNGRDGRDYVRLYMPDALSGTDAYAFPHIAIIDPRTGEQVKVWKEMPKTPIEFVHTVHEFLERYSLRDDDKNPVQRALKLKPKPKPVNLEAMTEAEQVELALQKSMDVGATASDELIDIAEGDGDLMEAEMSGQRRPEPKGKAIEQTPFQKISGANHHQEPAQGPASTRIQFKLHDGSRVVRRFLLKDTVERLFEFVKADLLPEREAQKEGGGNPNKEFELVSMGKRLIEVLDKTVEEAELKMGTIMVEALED